MDALALNYDCACWPIDAELVRTALPQDVAGVLDERHSHLFADTGVFISDAARGDMIEQMQTIESLALRLPLKGVRAADDQLKWPKTQRHTRGVLMGYDFHLTADGPRLIEVNTNAGGAFLVNHLTRTLGAAGGAVCGAGAMALAAERWCDLFVDEWRRAGRTGPPGNLLIVDDAPEDQYLYSDMKLAVTELKQRFTRVAIAAPQDLNFSDGRLRYRGWGDQSVDMVYNRLTDFHLTEGSAAALCAAWLADATVLTPSPRHHAELADKSNLVALSDQHQMQALGANRQELDRLKRLPATTAVCQETAADLWTQRKQLFFKPTQGYGGKAAFRGSKLTRRSWQQIVKQIDQVPYVAQQLVQPAERRLPPGSIARAHERLKFDVRLYTYAAQPLLFAARVYRGQTTNFRTPGGGFAPVAWVPNV